MDGANIADFIDPAIESKLAELEAEEEALMQAAAEGMDMDEEHDEDSLDEEEVEAAAAIRTHKGKTVAVARINESSNRPIILRLR